MTLHLKAHSDQSLLEMFQQGDRMAFNELYRRHWKELLDSAYKRLKDIGTAESIVQEVFVHLYVKRETLSIKVSLAAYLHTVLKNKVIDEIRKQIVRNTYRQELFDRPPATLYEDVHSLLEEKELKEKIDGFVETLPIKCKEVFLLKQRKHLSNKAIAEKLQISEKTVEGHLTHARKCLRIYLEGYSDYLTVAMLISFCSFYYAGIL